MVVSGDGARRDCDSREGRLNEAEQLVDLGGRDRPAEQEALQLVAPHGLQEALLLGRLDALGGHGQAQCAAQMHDRMHQDGAFTGRLHGLEEGPVDLDLVEGEAAQIDQRRVAGAEIVQGEAQAKGYAESGMTAYVALQESEFGMEDQGYTATRHQREVGAGYFDLISTIASAGASSTLALKGSTEEEQFH